MAEHWSSLHNKMAFERLCSSGPAVLRQDDAIAAQQACRTGARRASRRGGFCRRDLLRAVTRQQIEQGELLERYNRLVHWDQLMESKLQNLRLDRLIELKIQEVVQMTSSEEPMLVAMNDMPAMPDSAQPMPKCKNPEPPPRSETQRSRLWTIYEEEPVPVASLRIRGLIKPSKPQRPTPIELLRQSTEIRAKQDNQLQEYHNDTRAKRMGVLTKPIELKKKLQMKTSMADEEEPGRYFKGHVTLKSWATQDKGEDAILSLSDGNLSLVGGAELDKTLLSMSFLQVILGPVAGHDNCIHINTTKKKDNTAGVIIVLPSRSIPDEWFAASSSMEIKIQNWRTTPDMSA